jgi:hypothetical protein
MIELGLFEGDDPGFVTITQRIINGVIEALEVNEVYLTQIDNWFDWKWLGFWSTNWTLDENSWQASELVIPPFNPNRVRSEKRFVRDGGESPFAVADLKKPLHRRQPGRQATFRMPISRVSKFAAFIWYSGNTVVNQRGSVMVYRSDAKGYAWYASLTNHAGWRVNDEKKISRKELLTFEDHGRELEFVFEHSGCDSQ